MNCQRCKANGARYRVFTDILNLRVCTSCVIKALEIGLAVEELHRLPFDHQPGDIKESLDHLVCLN
jgi:hypothetical protein